MKVGLSLLPRIPLLFVATEREVAPAKSYLTSLISRPDPVVQPELFLIKREGHTNINQAEHLAAFRALNAWIDGGRDSLPKPAENEPYYDATVPADPGPSTAVIHGDGHGFDTKVAEVDAVYGNVLLEAQAADFASVGIAPMTYFELKLGSGSHRTLYGRTYTDVKEGEWIAFPDADGRTVLSRSYADAAGSEGLKFQFCIYYPAHPRYVYYFDPVKHHYWGRLDAKGEPGHQYSLLDPKDRKEKLKDIPEEAFPKAGKMPPIPESSDGTPMEPVKTLPKLGDKDAKRPPAGEK